MEEPYRKKTFALLNLLSNGEMLIGIEGACIGDSRRVIRTAGREFWGQSA